MRIIRMVRESDLDHEGNPCSHYSMAITFDSEDAAASFHSFISQDEMMGLSLCYGVDEEDGSVDEAVMSSRSWWINKAEFENALRRYARDWKKLVKANGK